MTKLEKIVFPLIFLMAAGAYVMSRMMSNDVFTMHWMAREDGVLEWLTVFALFSCAAACWLRCWTLRKHASNVFLSCMALSGAVFFFGMGEEISWGQRLFGIETPDFLSKVNAQKETNLHNLVVGGTNINKLVFGKILAVGLVMFLVAVPAAYRRNAIAQHWCDRLAIPVPRLQHTLAILVVVLMVETSRATKRGEITEFAISSFVFLLLLNPLNGHLFRKAATVMPSVVKEETALRRAA
jgi:hypothetical protein